MPLFFENTMTQSSNQEVTVRCPAEGCEKEVLSRALHLHVLRKNDDVHGEQGDIPPDLNLDDAERVGEQRVDVDYPDDREREESHRQCPYCKKTFRGKQGLEIHFGQVVGRKNHPTDRDEFPAAEDCPIVRLDENENIVERIDGDSPVVMPSTERRRENDLQERLEEHIEELRREGMDERANTIETALKEVAE